MHYEFYNTQNPCFDYGRWSMTLGPITFVIETNMDLDYTGFSGCHFLIRSMGEFVIACIEPVLEKADYPFGAYLKIRKKKVSLWQDV